MNCVCKKLGLNSLFFRGVRFNFGSEKSRDGFYKRLIAAEQIGKLSILLNLVGEMHQAMQYAENVLEAGVRSKKFHVVDVKEHKNNAEGEEKQESQKPVMNSIEDEVPFEIPDAPEFKDPNIYVPM